MGACWLARALAAQERWTVAHSTRSAPCCVPLALPGPGRQRPGWDSGTWLSSWHVGLDVAVVAWASPQSVVRAGRPIRITPCRRERDLYAHFTYNW